MGPKDVLKEYFGYDTFRTVQEDVISAILSGKDVMAIMPTGAGKSICFQIPAMLLPKGTVIISPLISLMKDQVEALTEQGIPASYVNSPSPRVNVCNADTGEKEPLANEKNILVSRVTKSILAVQRSSIRYCPRRTANFLRDVAPPRGDAGFSEMSFAEKQCRQNTASVGMNAPQCGQIFCIKFPSYFVLRLCACRRTGFTFSFS